MGKTRQPLFVLLLMFLLFLSVQGGEREGGYRRRVMIGSSRPSCTYNECRGCKFRCRPEQIPVEGNDPINTSYHYKCVCRHTPHI